MFAYTYMEIRCKKSRGFVIVPCGETQKTTAMQLELIDVNLKFLLHHHSSQQDKHVFTRVDHTVESENIRSQWRCTVFGSDNYPRIVIDSTFLKQQQRCLQWKNDTTADIHINAYDNIHLPFYMIIQVTHGRICQVELEVAPLVDTLARTCQKS